MARMTMAVAWVLLLMLSGMMPMAGAQVVDVCNTIVISTPSPAGVGCTCNPQSGKVECTSTSSQFCAEPEEEAVVVAAKEEECATQLSLEMTFGGSGNSLQQWSQLTQVTACVQGYTSNGQSIVDHICYDLDVCNSDGDSSICGCSVQYNQQACQDCVPCPNGRGILVDCSNLDPESVSIACVDSLRFASGWRSVDIRDDKDQAEMLERYRDDWQDEAIDFMGEWQDAWSDLLPHTLFRSDQLCDALHDYTAPVMNGDAIVEVTCDCQSAVLESENSYVVTCQSTQVCNIDGLCGTIQSTALIVDGEATTLQACADYDNGSYQQTCLSLDVCDVNGQHVLCNPGFTYGGAECTASLCNQDGTSLTIDCSNNADVTFGACQLLEPDGLMRFIPVITGGGESGESESPVIVSSPPTTVPPPVPSPTVATPMTTATPTVEGTPFFPTIAPTVVNELDSETPSPTILPSDLPSDMPSSFPSLTPTIPATLSATSAVTNTGNSPTTPVPFVAQTDEENEEQNKDEDDNNDKEGENDSEDGDNAASTIASNQPAITIIMTVGFILLLAATQAIDVF
jgi:hypothetical protein